MIRSRSRTRNLALLPVVALIALTAACSTDSEGSVEPVSDPAAPVAEVAPVGDSEPLVEEATVVLVHGAFAGPGSWDAVVPMLEAEGHEVVVPELPLRGVASDTEVLKDALDEIEGPIVLVGHSYGGIITSAAAVDDPDVEALVYVAAFATDEGESILGLQEVYPGSKAGPETLVFEPYTKADGTEGTNASIKPEAFAEVFAADLPAEVAAGAAAAQHPVELTALGEGAGPPAWGDIPSWYLIATADQVIPVAGARAMAERAGSETVEIDASHAVLVSQPQAVVALIDDAMTSAS